jgi:microcystin-dependent protein
MSEPFLSEIKLISFNFPPKGWAFCNGQLLPINQNQALFSLLGTTYGGNGQTTFALPDFRGRMPIHMGNGHTLGERSGAESHTVTQSQMPAHTHVLTGASTHDSASAAGKVWADQEAAPYSSGTPNTTLTGGSVSAVGGSQPHENRQPYLVLNFVIALQGIFPSQN